MNNTLYTIYESLLNGNISVINPDTSRMMNEIAIKNLNSPNLSDVEMLVKISNILYNNTDREILPLEDGVYDLLFELLIKNNINIVGSPPIKFKLDSIGGGVSEALPSAITYVDTENMLYGDRLFKELATDRINNYNLQQAIISTDKNNYNISRRTRDSFHTHPELVGTLLKSKFVLLSQAVDKGVAEDSNVRVLERDFFQKHIESGILDPNRIFSMILELKYDGISIEGDVSSRIISAGTRGDTSTGMATDLTPIFEDYIFPDACYVIPDNEVIGMNFEAIVTKSNMAEFARRKGREYKNGRSAIVGLLSSSDAYKYKDLITLVPLKTTLDIPREIEVEFMNKYYTRDEKLRYAIVTGNYLDIIFQIKKFVDEAEMLRGVLPFMYDGVVVSYLDEDIRKALGRKDFINRYSEAIKFNSMRKQTVFRGYTYTVGQDGTITPMIMYDPVEFFGTIHDKSSGHSYNRFLELGLKVEDIIDVEYVGDVMPYVTKPNNSLNDSNRNPVIEFINNCPSCNSKLVISESGKSKLCKNIDCEGKRISRIVNMMDKLNIKDFGIANLEKIGRYTLSDLVTLTLEEAKVIFPTDNMPYKLMDRIHEILTKPMEDYQIVGALGFSNIGRTMWKKILSVYTLPEILLMSDEERLINLTKIPNIGKVRAEVIVDEIPYFHKDLILIASMPNISSHKYNDTGKKIRFTGIRDAELVELLRSKGHDIGEGSVTKDTNLLIVPFPNHTSGKVSKAHKYNIPVVDIETFKENMEDYL